MPIIEVNHVTKEYQLGQIESLKTTALNQWQRLTGQPVEKLAPFKTLDDITFSIEAGEVVGIIGHNGAGKSTMLKLLANISKPSSGNITVKGKIAPLIEVGAGLVGDLTGRENIYLNGAILGISKAGIQREKLVLDPNGNREGAQALQHAMKHAWYEAVVEALQPILDYISLDQLFYANHFIDRMMRSTEHLIIHPEIARQ